MTDSETRACAPLQSSALALLEHAIDKQGLSSRAAGRVVKLARTIADLADCNAVSADHLIEALSFRLMDPGTCPDVLAA